MPFRIFNRALEIDFKNDKVLILRGDTYLNMGIFNKGLIDYDLAFELDEQYAQKSSFFASRGYIKEMLFRMEEALSDYDQAIILDKNKVSLFVSRGRINHYLGKYNSALSDVNHALIIDLNNNNALLLRGHIFLDMKRYEEALIDYDNALELDENNSQNPIFFNHRGRIYKELCKYIEALADFTQAIALDINDAYSLALRGEIYSILENYEPALSDLNRSLEVDGFFSLPIRGDTFRRMERYEEALIDYNKALEFDENNAQALAGRAKIHSSIGDIGSARVDIDKLSSYNPVEAWDFYYLAIAHVLNHNYQESIKMLTKACGDCSIRKYVQIERVFEVIRTMEIFKKLFDEKCG